MPEATRTTRLLERVRATADDVGRHDLFNSASAISFQLLTALVPAVLFAVALAGFLGLSELYERELFPWLGRNLSPAAFSLLDDTIRDVLANASVFWLTAGVVLATYQLSGAIRAAMDALDRIHGCDADDRPFLVRLAVSVLLALAVGALLLLAVALVQVIPRVVGIAVLGSLLGYVVAAAVLVFAIGLVVHFGPQVDRPLTKVTRGAVLCAAAWLGGSAAFGFYLTAIASYGSVYGSLASVVVLLAWLYLSALAFLLGALVDAQR